MPARATTGAPAHARSNASSASPRDGSVVGLIGGLRVVAAALAAHARDGARTNATHVAEDPTYVVFLAASVVAFGTVASGEAMSLRRRRARARKAVKECATMLDLRKAGDGTGAGKGKKRDGGKVGAEFWNDLGFLLRAAFP